MTMNRRDMGFWPGAEVFEPRQLLAALTPALVSHPQLTVVQALRADGRFTILSDALGSSPEGRRLARELSRGGRLLIAPTDSAFRDLPTPLRDALIDPANPGLLVRVLSNDMAETRRPRRAFGQDPLVTTESGRKLRLSAWHPFTQRLTPHSPIAAAGGSILPVDWFGIPAGEFSFLFSQVAASADVGSAGGETVLRLNDLQPTLAFADRPARLSYTMSAGEFADLWGIGAANGFLSDPPNAVLSYTAPDERRVQLEVELLDASAAPDGKGIAYRMRGVGPAPLPTELSSARLTGVSLFIDSLWSDIESVGKYAAGAVVIGASIAVTAASDGTLGGVAADVDEAVVADLLSSGSAESVGEGAGDVSVASDAPAPSSPVPNLQNPNVGSLASPEEEAQPRLGAP